jgi:hypothetical protein
VKRALGLALLVWSIPCFAQQPQQDSTSFQAVSTAKTLFEQGQKQLEDKNYEAACASFKASNEAVARVGTLLNLGDCYEKAGKLASAWGAYFDAISLGRRQGKPEYEEFATKKKDELEPRLSKLTLVVPAEVRVEGMKVTRDKALVEPAAYGVPMAVDPGTHVVDVTAPHKLPFHGEAVVNDEHKVVTITVEKLNEAPTVWPHNTEPQVIERVVQAPSVWTPLRVTGIVAGSAGVAAVIIGSVLGLVANNTYQNALKNECGNNPSACNGQGVADGTNAHALAAVATGLFIGGLVGVAGGITLFVVGAPASGGGTVTVGGRF